MLETPAEVVLFADQCLGRTCGDKAGFGGQEVQQRLALVGLGPGVRAKATGRPWRAASSGRTNRHRLSRGGDRGANAALYRIALVRMSSDSRTREYVARQTAAGRTKKEIIRLLKRATAREIFRYLTTPVAVPDIADLRPARRAKNITLTTVAEHFGVWPAVISCIERGTRRDDDLAGTYRTWLTAD
ncbi:transposase [Streptomyces sp. NPDC059970]|uniref:transposase n=1 Tax=Streptomyces sp. NPDC059970 TaxID=3347019 RepID=UPI003680379F